MSGHELDRPAWTALGERQGAFRRGEGRARRYDPTVALFAATEDDRTESLAALDALIGPGEMVVFLQADPVCLPDSLRPTLEAAGVQMVATQPLPVIEDARVRRLGTADAEDMLALALLTKPGPITLRAIELGRFWGIREGGRLVAMAGERMAQRGYVELSGVCSHPDARGKGLARQLSLYVAGQIAARGDVPYLHAYADNAAAIALYTSIGFALRTRMHVAMVERADG